MIHPSATPLKVLLLGDYSNCHRTLATGLRTLGCEVTVASAGSNWMKVERDVDISRRGSGRMGGLLHWLAMERLLRGKLSGFDVVSVHDPHFVSLRPERLRRLFDVLRERNRGVFYTAMSTDVPYIDMLEAQDSPLRYSEWFIDGRPSPWMLQRPEEWRQWHMPDLRNYQDYFFDRIDGAVSVLYEYHKGLERRLDSAAIAYAGLPVDTRLFAPSPETARSTDSPLRIFLGRDRHRMVMKGTDLLETAARRVIAAHPGAASLEIVENRPFKEFTGLLQNSDIVLDQIYSYTPATTALMAMSMGRAVVSGGEDDYYNFIGEDSMKSIINAPLTLDGLEDAITRAISNPEALRERGQESRRFVLKHNDSAVVAKRFLDFWQGRLQEKGR